MKHQIRGFITGVLITAILGTGVTVFANSEKIEVYFKNITVSINEKILENTDAKPFIYEGKAYVPIRFISENLGMSVYYDDYNNNIDISGSLPNNSTSGAAAVNLRKIKMYGVIANEFRSLEKISSSFADLTRSFKEARDQINTSSQTVNLETPYHQSYIEKYRASQKVGDEIEKIKETLRDLEIDIDPDISDVNSDLSEAIGSCDKAFAALYSYRNDKSDANNKIFNGYNDTALTKSQNALDKSSKYCQKYFDMISNYQAGD